MPNPKIVIVLTKQGIESVTVSATDSISRALGYELCKGIERELTIVNEAIKKRFEVVTSEREREEEKFN